MTPLAFQRIELLLAGHFEMLSCYRSNLKMISEGPRKGENAYFAAVVGELGPQDDS